MFLTDGAKDALSFCGSREFMTGLVTPIPERMAQNMMERAKIDPKVFKFNEFGGINRDANALFMTAISSAKSAGAEPDKDGVFVSSSPSLLSAQGR